VLVEQGRKCIASITSANTFVRRIEKRAGKMVLKYMMLEWDYISHNRIILLHYAYGRLTRRCQYILAIVITACIIISGSNNETGGGLGFEVYL
jgi:hypothetical protein